MLDWLMRCKAKQGQNRCLHGLASASRSLQSKADDIADGPHLKTNCAWHISMAHQQQHVLLVRFSKVRFPECAFSHSDSRSLTIDTTTQTRRSASSVCWPRLVWTAKCCPNMQESGLIWTAYHGLQERTSMSTCGLTGASMFSATETPSMQVAEAM
jgi:hypothetical protein